MALSRRTFLATSVAASSLALGASTAWAQSTELRIAHASPEESLIQQALLRYKDEVEAKTEGRVTISIFGNALLGDEGPVSEAVGDGSIDMGLGGVVDVIDPKLNALALPFLFGNFDAVHQVLDGPFGQTLAALAPPKGYVILGILDSGFRSFTNNVHPITSPADMQGLKLRVPPIPVALETIKAFGALPQTVPYGETYYALQSGVVDGAEPEIRDFYDAKWFEVQKYLSVSNYMWMPNYWYMNKARFDGLDPADQAVLTEAATAVQGWYRAQIATVYDDLMKTLAEAGVEINTVDTAPFRAMVGPVYELFAKEYGADFVAELQAAAEAAQK